MPDSQVPHGSGADHGLTVTPVTAEVPEASPVRESPGGGAVTATEGVDTSSADAVGRDGAQRSGKGSGAGRGAGRQGKGKGRQGVSAGKKGKGKTWDGWLPQQEYEAKKRDAAAKRQQDEVPKGAGKKGQKKTGWVHIPVDIPEPPEVPEETPESKERQETEKTRMSARDQLRSAVTAEELRAAIATAQALGLTDEAKVGERKLAKMEAS